MSQSDRVGALRRQADADPDNEALQLSLLNARARVEGEAVYLDLLKDRELWNSRPVSLQDSAIDAAGKRLKEHFRWLHTRLYSCAKRHHRIACFEHLKTGLEFHLLPAGHYLMGSADSATAWPAEQPQHQVTLDTPLLVARTPVLQRHWDALGGFDERGWRRADSPIESVRLQDVEQWLADAGRGLRLPSEAEWEYACRAGSDSTFFWGYEQDDRYFWHAENSGDSTHDLALHSDYGNAFGLIDMLGHVWEMCLDDWIINYDSGPHDAAPRFKADSPFQVVRGGSWYSSPWSCRPACRHWHVSDRHSDDIGFRPVMSLPL